MIVETDQLVGFRDFPKMAQGNTLVHCLLFFVSAPHPVTLGASKCWRAGENLMRARCRIQNVLWSSLKMLFYSFYIQTKKKKKKKVKLCRGSHV